MAETTPLIVKYIHKGNIHYLVEKQQLKKFAIRRPHLSIKGGGQLGVVEDNTRGLGYALSLIVSWLISFSVTFYLPPLNRLIIALKFSIYC